jgi:hypothetical protein
MSATFSKRFLSKSKLSTFLRTQCDRQLYLSLFSNDPKSLAKDNLPIPIKTRTSVQLITQSGREFEIDQFDRLVAAIPGHIVAGNNYGPIALETTLTNPPDPAFILQPSFDPEKFRNKSFDNLGLNQAEKNTIPTLDGLRPDILFVHDPIENDYEVLPNGNRNWIDRSKEKRKAISVIDLKNVTEANASYAAEVCLYAFFLSNWLDSNATGLKSQYYVSHRVYLWKNIEMPNFEQMISTRQGADPKKRIEAILHDLEDGLVEFLIYMPSVKKFFKEDIPRVVTKGDNEGWQAVNYHVNPKCGSCDWLGNKDWLWGDSLAIYNAHPDHYCFYAAEVEDHLSKMAGLSKGASHILTSEGKTQLAHLVDIPSATPVLKRHTFLKKDRSQIGSRARAIVDGISTVDDSVRIGGLARFRNAEYSIIVNFDAGAGLLTGASIRGIVFFPPGQQADVNGSPAKYLNFHEEAFVIVKDNHIAEGASLLSFINRFASWIAQAEEIFSSNGWGLIHTQIHFWEKRQYQELCNAFGRHLLEILNLSERNQRALAWIFPAEELIEKDQQIAPGIVFIQDVVEASVRPAVKFCNTLLGIASVYHYGSMPPRNIDKYYVEPLGNAIPRERIFEIWKSPSGVVRMHGKNAPISEAITRYGDVLKAHTWALSSVAAKLREDLGNRLQAQAPALKLSIPQGARQIAYDSKLWLQWDYVESSTAQTEGKLNLITKAERLEASYKAIVLGALILDLGNNRYMFQVSDESTESKLEEGSAYFVLGYVNDPGFPLQTAASLGIHANSQIESSSLWIPLHKVISVTVHRFDRANKRIEISIAPSWFRMEVLFEELVDQGHLSVTDRQIYILEGLPWNDTSTTERILRSIGNPSNANISQETLTALGVPRRRVAPGTDAVTPISRILWEADALSISDKRTDAQAKALASFARGSNKHGLNESQESAIYNCTRKQLSVIWGPPGTGKTDTLASLVHSIVNESQTLSITKKILITGPNYRAVEELAERIIRNVNRDEKCICDMFMVYSQSREPKIFSETSVHFNLRSFSLRNNTEAEQELISSLRDPNRITIVATTAHAISNITRLLHGGKDAELIQSLYDLIIIDESSQVPVNLALRPFAALKQEGQIIIAGDHLQMPPITSLEPPKNAEYLVGSIQTYLIRRFPRIHTQKLLINYRSNQDLVDFAKTLGYPSDLKAHERDRRIELISDPRESIENLRTDLPVTDAYEDILNPNKKVITLIHEDIVSSQANELEAKLVASIAFCLRHSASSDLYPSESGFAPFSDDLFFKRGLGVVTPHKAQKALVLRELRKLFPSVLPELIFEAVDTVERFQGGERHTVIVSFGVGDTDIISGEEAFLLQMERTNVAVSRAKAKCIVIMPKALAYHLPSDEKVAQASKAIKSYIEEFCHNRRDIDIIDHLGEIRKGEVRWH